MAITVKHTKVSTIPDGDDSSLIRPSDWNADHTLVGLGTMAEQNANNVAITGGSITGVSIPNTSITGLGTMSTQNANSVSITGGSISGATVSGYIPTSAEGVANGVATLDGSGKVPIGQIPDAVIGALNYQGTWNATTNSPTLTSSVGTKGFYYVVSVAGSTNLNGITDWQVGDWVVYNGTAWQKVDNTDGVTSVNGFTGAVTLTTTNIAEGTNEYFTTARARASVSAGTGISYDSSTGVISSTVTPGTGDVVGPSSATDNAIARFDTTTGKLIQNSVVTVSDTGAIAGATTITDINYVDFNTAYATTLGAGQIGWDGYNTLGLGMMGGNVIQHIGEDTFFYVKASSAITKGQLCMFTGAVGSSGVLTAAPSNSIPFAEAIMGIAAEDIALNGFGLIQITGTLKGVDTSAFSDGDVLYYNSAVTGGLTATYPASGPIVIVAAVANAGSGGSGVLTVRVSFQTRVSASTGISVTQTNNAATITNTAPDQVVSLTAGTGISTSGTYPNFTVTNTAPDQTVTMTSGTGISVTGTYPNFTVTNTSPSSGGTVTSVSGTAPIASSGGNTPTISISQSTTSTDGYLSSTDWNTFNNKATYPSQTGNSGKFLTTNGSATSWATLPTVLPVMNRAGSTVSVAVGNGLLPVLTHSGTTINVAVQ